MSYILSIDSSTNEASVAVSLDNRILCLKKSKEQKEHAGFIQTAIEKMFEETGISGRDLAAVAVTTGPGSYTGLRVGMASAKGFCYALQIPLIAIGTLNVMAYAARQFLTNAAEKLFPICPMIDARRMEVFTSLVSPDLECLQVPRALILDEHSFATELTNYPGVYFLGSGSEKWQRICKHPKALFLNTEWDARHLAELAFPLFQNKEFTSLAYSAPFYLKEFQTSAH
jgi:tRNA threonylcarbamoyladenosine biosynthesis protein TsaB